MKRVLSILLISTMMLGLTACGLSPKAKWTDEDLTFKSESDEVQVTKDTAIIVYEDYSSTIDYDSVSFEEFDYEYTTNRGLALGMTIDDYKELYTVINGYAIWECFTGDENEYTQFEEYKGQKPSEMYEMEDSKYNNVWLDIGFSKKDGKWSQMKDFEVMDTWFCDADLDDFEECVVFAVNFDKWGKVCGISLEHFTYDEGWVEWQGWDE